MDHCAECGCALDDYELFHNMALCTTCQDFEVFWDDDEFDDE